MAVLLAQRKGLQIKRQSLGAFPSTHTLQHSTPNSLGSLVSWDHFKIGVGSRQPNKRARKTYGSWQIRTLKQRALVLLHGFLHTLKSQEFLCGMRASARAGMQTQKSRCSFPENSPHGL